MTMDTGSKLSGYPPRLWERFFNLAHGLCRRGRNALFLAAHSSGRAAKEKKGGTHARAWCASLSLRFFLLIEGGQARAPDCFS